MTAIERDPQYAHAHSLLAFINIIEHALGWWGDRSAAELRADAAEAARTAIKIDPDDEAARTRVEAWNTLWRDWEYELPGYQVENIIVAREDLIKQEAAEAESQ